MFAWESRNLIRSYIYTNIKDFVHLGALVQWNDVIWPAISPTMQSNPKIAAALPDELFTEGHYDDIYFKVCNAYESGNTEYAGPEWSNFILESSGGSEQWDVRSTLYWLLKTEVEAGINYGLCHFLALRVRKFLEEHDLDPLDEQSYDDLEDVLLAQLGVDKSDLKKINPSEFDF